MDVRFIAYNKNPDNNNNNQSVCFLSCVGNMTIFSKLSMKATRILMDALSINTYLLHLR